VLSDMFETFFSAYLRHHRLYREHLGITSANMKQLLNESQTEESEDEATEVLSTDDEVEVNPKDYFYDEAQEASQDQQTDNDEELEILAQSEDERNFEASPEY